MNNMWKIARSELIRQVRAKGTMIAVAIAAVMTAGLVAGPQLIDMEESYQVGLVGSASERLTEPLESLSDRAEIDVTTTEPGGASEARASVDGGELDLAVVDDGTVLSDGEPEPSLMGLLQSAHESVGVMEQLQLLDLSQEEVAQALQVQPLQVESVSSGGEYEEERGGITFIILMVLLFLFMSTTVGLAAGIVEEKGGRIVEILLVAVRPWQLLAGKLVAFGLTGLLQLVAVAVSGLGTAAAVGIIGDLPPGMAGIIAAAFAGYVLGYLFFGAMAAAMGSLVSRQEDTNGALAPVTAATILSFMAAYVVFTQPDGLVSQVLAILPPVSSIAMPVRISMGDAAVWEVLTATGLMLAAIGAMVLLGARIYERSVLHTGARVKWTEAIRSERV